MADYRTGTAQDAETTSAITAALLACYTSSQVDALLGDYRTASAQDTQTQAAIAGALLAYRTDQDVFTTNQITSALVAYRSAADQDTATASSIAAALLSYYTIAQVDGLLAGKLGVTEAASALQIAGRLTVKLDGPPQQRLQRGPGHAHRESERGRLHPDPGDTVRTYNLTPGRELLFACRYRLGTASNFVVYMSEADNVYDPLYGSFVGDQGAWSTAKMYFTVPPNGVAKLHFGAHFQAFDSVEAKQYKRPDMNGDLRLGFASDDFAGTKWKNLTGTTRWSDGTEMVTLDYSHLTSVLWGVCKGFQARLDEVEAWQAQRGPKNK